MAESQPFNPKDCLGKALDLIQEYSIQNNGFEWSRKKEIDWAEFRKDAWDDLKKSGLDTESRFLKNADAEIEGKFCEVVNRAIAKLEDNHSGIFHFGIRKDSDGHYYRIEPKGTVKEKAKEIHDQKEPEVEILENGILHLILHSFNPSVRTDKERTRYQNILRDALLNTPGIRGVIVDLTKDANGGDPGPMVRGLSSLLGSDPLVYFLGSKWPEASGTNINNPGMPAKEWDRIDEKNPDNFPHVDIPVAMLHGPNTVSALEYVALSFRGRENTKSFGAPTGGMTSGNNLFDLTADGKMQICVCQNVMRNRDKTVGDGASIQPDVRTDDPLREAVAWLKSGMNPGMDNKKGSKTSVKAETPGISK